MRFMKLPAGFRGCCWSAMLSLTLPVVAESVPRMLPGETSADAILGGASPFPPSPQVVVKDDTRGFDPRRISKVPPPGVHPRVLISPDDLPDLRRRLRETAAGRALHANLRERTNQWLRDPAHWSSRLYDMLAAGDKESALKLIAENKGMPASIGHYQPWIYAIVLEAFDAMLSEDDGRGTRAATAVATYAELIRPHLDEVLDGPLNDDVWRAKTSGPVTGAGISSQGLREGVGGHLLGYAYDFAHNFMTNAQRATVRGVIAKATHGRVWMGARLPRHFRNWNWIAVGLQQPLLALAIEGEEGYDPRVFQLGVEIARDYLTYGISPMGQSTEAVGYTQFGLVWGNPFFVAASRRGHNLLVHGHHRAMLDWYLHSMEPTLDHFTSHGDGGDGPPKIWTLAMWRHFFPDDPRTDFLWQSYVTRGFDGMATTDGVAPRDEAFSGDFHLIEPMLWAQDPKTDASGKLIDYRHGAALGLPGVAIDAARGSLNARSGWSPDATTVQFECRVDSVGSSHEHADRGNFTLFSHGRAWAKENFRSVETRHHNHILIDGMGQGFWPGPGRWLGHHEKGDVITATIDAADAYRWWWPKEILNRPDDWAGFGFARWQSYQAEAATFRRKYEGAVIQRDDRPAVAAFWKGYESTDPRLWDEDGWPVRLEHNPVRKAFRSIAFHRGRHPWLLVADDIRKDDRERLYEWLMQTGFDTELVALSGNDIILGDAGSSRDRSGRPVSRKGDRRLLVRVLDLGDPADPHHYSSRPSFRLEAFERKDTLLPDAGPGSLSGSRSFGIDKRLVVASRSVSPDFKILLFPHRHGEPLPETRWERDTSRLSITIGTQSTTLRLGGTPGKPDLIPE